MGIFKFGKSGKSDDELYVQDRLSDIVTCEGCGHFVSKSLAKAVMVTRTYRIPDGFKLQSEKPVYYKHVYYGKNCAPLYDIVRIAYDCDGAGIELSRTYFMNNVEVFPDESK